MFSFAKKYKFIICLALADISASLSYVYAGYILQQQTRFISSNEFFAYSNIAVVLFLILLSPILSKVYKINLFSIKEYILNKKLLLALFLTVACGMYKAKLMNSFTQVEVRGYAILSPFVTLLFCHLFLQDQKINKKILFYFLLALIGFVIFNFGKIGFVLSVQLLIYAIMNGLSDFGMKAVSSARGVKMMLFDNLMYLFCSMLIFIYAEIDAKTTMQAINIGKFDITKILYIKEICILGFISMLAHNFKMLSYKVKHISGALITGITSKNITSILGDLIARSLLPNTMQVIGLAIMSFAVLKNKKSNQ